LSEFKYIVRMAGKDLDGSKKLIASLCKIKGLGYGITNAIVNHLRLDSKTRLGTLSDQQISEISKTITDLNKLGFPNWMLNRRKDIETGSNFHLTGADLIFTDQNDFNRERFVGSWKGIRKSLGLKVRGQCTRTSGRKHRTVGVRKADLKPKPGTAKK